MDNTATPNPLSQMLTLEQVAWVLQKPERTVRQMTKRREIGSNKMGGDLRYLLQDVWAYIGKTRQVAMPTPGSDPGAEDLDWGRIQRLIVLAARAEVQVTVQSLKSNVQSPESRPQRLAEIQIATA